MKRFFLPLLLAAALVVGCTRKDDKPSNETSSQDTALAKTLAEKPGMALAQQGRIPGDQAVWAPETELTRASLDQTIITRTSGLDQIYHRALEQQGGDLSGRISLEMPIYPDGSLGIVRVTEESWSDPAWSSLTDSMLSYVQTWTFPPAPDRDSPLSYTQPWRFEP